MALKLSRPLLQASYRAWWDSGSPRVGPGWLQWLWTFLFCAMLAVPFTILGSFTYASGRGSWRSPLVWLEWYGRNLLVCLVIGALIHLAFDLISSLIGGLHRARRWPKWRRTLLFSGVPLLCTMVGWPFGAWLAGAPIVRWAEGGGHGHNVIAGSVFAAVLLTFLFHQFFAIKSRQMEAEKRATEAQLRLLQGQIEPHFLFNTLAGVISLIDHEPAKAKQMLQDFTEYLRSSLGAMRSGEGPLTQELDLAEHYLRLLGSRMEDRLRWRIDADEAARRVPVPPLLLQPLVENAIHHGLEPQLEGGTVLVSARIEGRQLVLQVQDDGRGLDAPARPGARPGPGVALANIRGRLQSRYGVEASLELQPAHPGTRAVIRLPIDSPPAPGETP